MHITVESLADDIIYAVYKPSTMIPCTVSYKQNHYRDVNHVIITELRDILAHMIYISKVSELREIRKIDIEFRAWVITFTYNYRL